MEQNKKTNSIMESKSILKNEKNFIYKMKRKKLKMLFTVANLCLLLFSRPVNAQITLEHTFDGNASAYWNNNNVNSVVNFALNYYIYANTTTNQVRFYNADYSLHKSVTITPPSNYSFFGAYAFSRNVVTTDSKISFCVIFSNTTIPDQNLRYNLKMYNEDGVMLKDLGYMAAGGIPSFHIVSNNYRLLLLRYIWENSTYRYETEIYSLPGIVLSPPIITTNSLPNGIVGTEYNATLIATGDEPIIWSLESGNLPNGLNLSSTGVISGTPTVSETFDFAVKATNEAGIGKKELFIVIDEKTGMSTLQIAEMKIYPNPTNGKLFIESENSMQGRIIFYDITGKEVINKNIFGKTEINIDNLQKGVYIVSVVSESEVIGNFKIVKQ